MVVARYSDLSLAPRELLFTSTIIQFALALPMAWYFHRATTMALPANALMIPIAGSLVAERRAGGRASYAVALAGLCCRR